MPRHPRIQFPGAVYHVHSRGNRKGQIFEDDVDREQFLKIVADATSEHDVRDLDYSEMGTHYHMVLETPRGNLSDVMRDINGNYTQWTNRRHKRWGHLFGARFSAWVVQDRDYLRRLARYLARNPVEGGLATDPANWRWSGYRALAGLDPAPGFLCTDWLELAFECDSHSEAIKKYRLYVNDDAGSDELPKSPLSVIGGIEFEARVRRSIGESNFPQLPRTYRSLARPPLAQLFPLTDISKAARNLAIQHAHQHWGYRLAEIALHLGIHPSTASLVVRALKQKKGKCPND